MATGGFLVKFVGGKTKSQRCYSVAFDYKELPKGTKKITVEIE